MTISPAALLEAEGLQICESIRWGTPPSTDAHGVYVVSVDSDPRGTATSDNANIDFARVAQWIERVPTLLLHGERPSPEELSAHLARWWLADQTIVYIGKAAGGKGLRGRIKDYYRTALGDPKPHSGGHWIKTLQDFGTFTVHIARTPPALPAVAAEDQLLRRFMRSVSERTRAQHPDRDAGLTLPFANLEWCPYQQRRKFTRAHGMKYTRLGP